jgi:hypothetical protein
MRFRKMFLPMLFIASMSGTCFAREAFKQYDFRLKDFSENETTQLKKYENRVRREGKSLELTLGSGKKLTLANNSQRLDEGMKGSEYIFLDLIEPINYYLLKNKKNYGLEYGIGYIFVNAENGGILKLAELPTFSQDRRKLFSAKVDEHDGWCSMEVWSISASTATLEWSDKLRCWQNVNWVDNDAMQLDLLNKPNETYILSHQKGSWNLKKR